MSGALLALALKPEVKFYMQRSVIKLFFGGEEVSLAKVFSAVYELAPSLPRGPFESMFGLLLFPIPRNLIGIKPFGASMVFTQQVSPFRWEWTNSESETLITGYGDVYWQFWTFGAFLAILMLGSLWLWLCLKVIHSSPQIRIAWTPLLIWWMFIFVRSDIFNLGLLLWPVVTTFVLHRILQRVFDHLLRSAPYEL
jgi:hypothetical protein